MKCAKCDKLSCIKDGVNCSKYDVDTITSLNDDDKKLVKTAPIISVEKGYKDNRLNEIIDFAKAMGYEKIGVAFCASVKKEAEILHTILEKTFAVSSVCCKIGGFDCSILDIPKKRADIKAPVCNSVTQAKILNDEGTELNILMGLCVGHDILLQKYSNAPCTTFLVRDFTMFHNPVGLLYSDQYFRKEKRK